MLFNKKLFCYFSKSGLTRFLFYSFFLTNFQKIQSNLIKLYSIEKFVYLKVFGLTKMNIAVCKLFIVILFVILYNILKLLKNIK